MRSSKGWLCCGLLFSLSVTHASSGIVNIQFVTAGDHPSQYKLLITNTKSQICYEKNIQSDSQTNIDVPYGRFNCNLWDEYYLYVDYKTNDQYRYRSYFPFVSGKGQCHVLNEGADKLAVYCRN